MSFARAAYTALLYLLLPYVRLRLAWRARREPGYREHLDERFGRYRDAGHGERLIWIHAVSVGETAAAEPLVRALQRRYPQYRILLTHMTPTGRRTGVALYGESVLRAYLPYDFPRAVARFLEHFRPRLGLLIETEIWPNLIHACAAGNVPLYLVNARLSERSYRGYRRLGGLVRDSVRALTAVAAQASGDAARLSALGARNVTVVGNVKFDAAPPAPQVELGHAWRAGFGARGVVLAASTREGEEELVLDAFERIAADAMLVMVPRHPQRFDDVAAMLEKRGLSYERRSTGAAVTNTTRVLLGDSMGEMAAYYAACDVAFIGGSLLPFGGHNFIEACAVGTPVLLGPHTYNFAEAAQLAIGAGAALPVGNVDELARTVDRLLRDDTERARMREAALAFSRAHQGATERILEMLSLKDEPS